MPNTNNAPTTPARTHPHPQETAPIERDGRDPKLPMVVNPNTETAKPVDPDKREK